MLKVEDAPYSCQASKPEGKGTTRKPEGASAPLDKPIFKKRQTSTLEDYVQTSLMLQYNYDDS